LAFIIVILILFLVLRSARVVPAGHVGVVDLFGKVHTEALPSGLHLVNPLANVIGAGKEGLPIILGGDYAPAAPHPSPPGR
jgi:regulator of protease activity HflC (stomatin/prohibitin superfamily)